MYTLQGRTCVYSGATGNIGRNSVLAMASGGMNVMMGTHNPESAAEIVAACQDMSGKVEAFINQKPRPEVLREIVERYGNIDVMICTTGILDPVKPIEDITPEELNAKLNHQITGAFTMVQDTLPYLRQSKHGRIILCASTGAQTGMCEENLADNIARGGVISMTLSLARLLAPEGITVNCIARSGMINDHSPTENSYNSDLLLNKIPLGIQGTSDHFAALVAYLASEEAGFITGNIFSLSGGLQLR